MSRSSEVVVTGLAPVTAIGVGPGPFWDAICQKKSGIISLEHREDDGPRPPAGWMDSAKAGIWIGAPIRNFVPDQYVRPRKALKVMGRELQTSFAASSIAMEGCGLIDSIRDGVISPERVATVFGSQMFYCPPVELKEAFVNCKDESGVFSMARFGATAMRDVVPLWMLKYLPNMPACHVGISIGALGANNTIVAGDVSATSALIESVGVLRRGIADAVICGVAGTAIDTTRLLYRNDLPVPAVGTPIELSSRPHTRETVGVVGGEAAVTIVLETARSAQARMVPAIAVVAGGASRFCRPSTGRRGAAGAIAEALHAALRQADIGPDSIGLVMSHGTGDPQRDEEERRALDLVLPSASMVMTIATTGYSGAASGGVHLITGLLALMHRTAPPSFLHGTAYPGWSGRFSDSPRPLLQPAVAVITHTSEGVANAVILRSP